MEQEAFVMVIDLHAHLHFSPTTQACTQTLLRTMDVYGIDKAYVSNVDGGYYPTPEIVRRNNESVAELIRLHPDRFGGAVYVNPRNSDAEDVLRRGFEDQGMSLVKLWVASRADDPCVDPVMEYAESIGVPVLFHTFKKVERVIPTEPTGVQIASIARRHPHTKIIMAHFGADAYDALPAIRDCPNVWCNYALSIFVGDAMDYAVETIGVDRIVYGSDMPGVSVPVNLGKVLTAGLTPVQRDKIFYQNARKLLDRSFRL